jgi:hypothetical protein
MSNPINYQKLPGDPCLTQDQLFQYIDGKLNSAEMHDVEKHLTDCGFCSDALEGLELSRDRSKVAAFIPFSGNQKKREEEDEDRPKVIPFFRQRGFMYAVAASVTVILGVTIIMRWSLGSAPMNKEVAQAEDRTVNSRNMDSIGPAKPDEATALNTKKENAAKENRYAPLAGQKSSDLEKSMSGPKAISGEGQDMSRAAKPSGNDLQEVQQPVAAYDDISVVDEDKSVLLSQTDQRADSAMQKTEQTASAVSKERAKFKKPSLGGVVTPTAPQAASGAAASYSNSDIVATESENKNQASDTVSARQENAAAAKDSDLDLSYQTGVDLLASGQATASLTFFDEVLKNPNHHLYEDAEWKKADALIKLNRKDEAKKILNEIVARKGRYAAQAEAKLKTL